MPCFCGDSQCPSCGAAQGTLEPKEIRHTPGPWRISDFERLAGEDSRCIMGADGFAVAWIDGSTIKEHEADARLIAAAPDLLDALKEVVRISDRKHNAWDKAHAAIAKAEGRDV